MIEVDSLGGEDYGQDWVYAATGCYSRAIGIFWMMLSCCQLRTDLWKLGNCRCGPMIGGIFFECKPHWWPTWLGELMTEPAWSDLFSGAQFEFHFGARPGDPEEFFESSPERDGRVQLRREIVAEHPERHVFRCNSHDAVTELIRWAGLNPVGRELAQHWGWILWCCCRRRMVRMCLWPGRFVSPLLPGRRKRNWDLPVHTIHDPCPP